MDGISTRGTPAIQFVRVHKRIASLKIDRELQKSIVLVVDVFPGDLLLDYFLSPIVIEPRLFNFLLGRVREEKGVFYSGDIEVNLGMR